MTEPEDLNPYTSPSEEGGGQPLAKSYRPVLRLFVFPFFLAHLVFWPSFFLFLAITNSSGYGADAALYATIAIAVSGVIYGGIAGMLLRAGTMGNVNVWHPVLYAVGQGIWFVFCVFAPCAVFVVGATV